MKGGESSWSSIIRRSWRGWEGLLESAGYVHLGALANKEAIERTASAEPDALEPSGNGVGDKAHRHCLAPRSLHAVATIAVGVLTISCASLLPRPDTLGTAAPTASRERCEAISSSFGAWGVVGAVGGVTALASGVTNAILKDDVSDPILGITSLVAGITAGVSAALSANAARTYVDACTINSGGAVAVPAASAAPAATQVTPTPPAP